MKARAVATVPSLLFVGLLTLLVSAACGSTTTFGGCDSAKCLPGNTCIAVNGDNRCRKTCTSNTNPTKSCPFGYLCQDPQNGGSPFCVASTATVNGQPIVSKPTGQWGASCLANQGLENNPTCDSAQGFKCFGHSPTDAEAYCTRYDCATDTDCGPGFYCGQTNKTPDVTSAKRTTAGAVENVCIRRAYCAPCTVDLDCPDIAGNHQHCIADDSGKNFCAPECQSPGTCPVEAKCIADPALGASITICYPRAKICVGDGSLCAPCRVDTDCGADGICLRGDYTTEHSCAKKAPSGACTSCPKTVTTPARSVGCLDTAGDTQPADYCFGVYSIGGQPSDVGCYSPDR